METLIELLTVLSNFFMSCAVYLKHGEWMATQEETGIGFASIALCFALGGLIRELMYKLQHRSVSTEVLDNNAETDELVIRVIWTKPGATIILAEYREQDAVIRSYITDSEWKESVLTFDKRKFSVTNTYISGCKGKNGKTKLKIVEVQPLIS